MTDESGVTLRALLPATLDGLESTIEGELRDGKKGNFSTLGWRFVRSSAADQVGKVLDFDVWHAMAYAWAKASELRSHAESPPGETHVVHLGKHDFKTAMHPQLTIDLGLPPYPKLVFTLEIAAHFEGAALCIREGHIVAVETGDATVYAELKYGKVRLHKEESPKVKLAGRRDFKAPGIRIE